MSPSLHTRMASGEPNDQGDDKAPAYAELFRRLRLVTTGIDFLLGNPDLKPTDRELGLMILRQTALFGKEIDKITAKQQASGVRNLNRGTRRHPKTLQRARARLRKAGFMRVFNEPGDRRGNTYSPDFEHMNSELQKLRTPGQIAPEYPGAKCSPHQSYPSGSDSQSSARLAGSQPAAPGSRANAGGTAQPDVQRKPERSKSTPPAPWKLVDVAECDVELMLVHLAAISEAYPRSSFGSVNRTTARDFVAAAKLNDPDANADHVAELLAWKFRQKRPYPYERGIQTFGGMLRIVVEDFGAWFCSQKREKLAQSPPPQTPPLDERTVDNISASQPKGIQLAGGMEMNETAESVGTLAAGSLSSSPTGGTCSERSAVPCSDCLGKGYILDESGVEQLAGAEVKTIAAMACGCSKGHEMGYARLAAIERTIAERRGVGWISAHRAVD